MQIFSLSVQFRLTTFEGCPIVDHLHNVGNQFYYPHDIFDYSGYQIDYPGDLFNYPDIESDYLNGLSYS